MKFMKIAAAAVATLASLPSFAGTPFSNQEALSALLASNEFKQVVSGQLTTVSIRQTGGEPALVYDFELSYTEVTPVGIIPCRTTVKIATELLQPADGTTTSRLGKPRFGLVA